MVRATSAFALTGFGETSRRNAQVSNARRRRMARGTGAYRPTTKCIAASVETCSFTLYPSAGRSMPSSRDSP
jgi:hypothetical protein